MGIKILDVELGQLPRQVTGLAGYGSALILLRYCGRPVGQIQVPVRKERIGGADLRDAVMAAIGPEMLSAWLEGLVGKEAVSRVPGQEGPVTVAVCTRDRPEDLRKCLESLAQLPDDGQEVLVVDNCPKTGATKQVARGHRCRYIREDQAGLDCARNRAMREAKGWAVAFIDDDAVADAGWLRALLANFNDPLVLAVTGLTLPSELETEAQETFERLTGFARGFRRRSFSLQTLSPAAAGAVGAGANMALRRSVLLSVGAFDEALDAGTVTQSGGDTEMFSRIIGAGYKIVYEPGALNWHRHRRTWPELRQTLYGYGVGLYAAWTRSLIMEREWGVLRVAGRWLFQVQLRRMLRSILRRPGAYPMDLILAEMRGSCVGPWAYWLSRSRLRNSPPS